MAFTATCWAQATQPVSSQPAPSPSESTATAPNETQPAYTHPLLSREARTARLIEHLHREYSDLLKSRDWMNRSIALVCMARVPGPTPNKTFLETYKNDQHEIVRLVAFHCLMSRAKVLDEQEHDAFLATTVTHINKGAFKGETRAAVVKLLSVNAPDKAAKTAWRKYFAESNLSAQGGASGDDRELIAALGECLGRWKSPDLVEFLIERMGTINDAYRAERVLRLAAKMDAAGDPKILPAIKYASKGSEVAWRTAATTYREWQKKEKWEEAATTLELRRSLRSPFIADTELDPTKIDPADPSYRADLELRSPDLRSLNVSFVIDATGSMQAGINWVKNELTRAMAAFSLVSKEPRVGVTFYRDKNDEFVAQTSAMVGPSGIRNLIDYVGKMKAEGGGDMPEAVREGILDSIQRNPWPQPKDAKKIVIVVADAPPHEETQAEIEKGVTKLADERGFRFYTVALSSASHKEMSAIAKAGKGEHFDVAIDYMAMFRPMLANADGLPPEIANEFAWNSKDEKPARPAIAIPPRPGAEDAAIKTISGVEGIRRLLERVMVDAINPQYKDRVAPIVAILVTGLSANAEPERRRHFKAFDPLPRRGPVRVPIAD